MGNLEDKADNGNSLDKSVRLTPTGGIHSGGAPKFSYSLPRIQNEKTHQI